VDDLTLETIRAVILCVALIFLSHFGTARADLSRKGWRAIVGGFGLLLFGSVLDITDNFDSLNTFVVVGDTEVEAILEKLVGFLGGFLLLTIGLVRWMPTVTSVQRLRHLSQKLAESNQNLGLRVDERTRDLGEANRQLEETVSTLEATNRELERAMADAKSANQVKAAFLANISHELRTPLHAILSFSHFGVKNDAELKDKKLIRYFEQIRDSGTALLSLVDSLLDLSNLESGGMQLDLRTSDLVLLIDEVITEFDTLVVERKLSIHFAKPSASIEVTVDTAQLKKVIRNLLSNAVKFSPRNGTIHLNATRKGGIAMVSMRDEGPGIPANELARVFENFVQSTSTNTGAGGTGLGLAICSQIVAKHGGRIWAEAIDDGGTRVALEIPVSAEDRSRGQNGAEAERRAVERSIANSSDGAELESDERVGTGAGTGRRKQEMSLTPARSHSSAGVATPSG